MSLLLRTLSVPTRTHGVTLLLTHAPAPLLSSPDCLPSSTILLANHAWNTSSPDPQVLHDAFFKHQKPPPLTGVGELYYEGKEYEARITHCRPGACACVRVRVRVRVFRTTQDTRMSDRMKPKTTSVCVCALEDGGGGW